MAPQGPDTHDVRGERQSAEPQAVDTDSSSLGLRGEEVDFITGQRYSQAQVRGHVLGAQAAALRQFYAGASANRLLLSMPAFASLCRKLRSLGKGHMHACGMPLPCVMVLLHCSGGGC